MLRTHPMAGFTARYGCISALVVFVLSGTRLCPEISAADALVSTDVASPAVSEKFLPATERTSAQAKQGLCLDLDAGECQSDEATSGLSLSTLTFSKRRRSTSLARAAEGTKKNIEKLRQSESVAAKVTTRKSRRLYTEVFAPPQLIAASQLPGITKEMLPLAEPLTDRPNNPPKRSAIGKAPAARSGAQAAAESTAAVRDLPSEPYIVRPPRRVERPQLAKDSEKDTGAPKQTAVAAAHQLAGVISTPRRRREGDSTSENNSGATATTAPHRLPAISSNRLKLVSRTCQQHIAYGMDLASRGAAESARQEFIDVLNRISQTLDYGVSDDRHSKALTAGLTAMREAEDFQSGAERLATDIDLSRVVATHQTEVLKNDPILAHLTPMMALRKYLEYGKRQLTTAAGGQPVASQALYYLGRLETAELKANPRARPISGPRAIAFHQIALQVDSRNHMAANELGVLFARYGQLKNAREVLRHATKISTEPETWYNLAKVYELEGAAQQAAYALNKYEQLRKGSEQASKKRPEQVVNWVSPEAFRSSADPAGLGLHERSATKLDESVEPGIRKSEVAKKQAVSERAKNRPLQSLGRLFQGKKASSGAAD